MVKSASKKIFRGRAKCIPKRDALFLPSQKRWIEDDSRLKLAEKSRQIGWTWTSAYRLVRKKSQAKEQLDAWVTSRDDFQAKLFLEDCKSFANILQIGASEVGESIIDHEDGKKKSTAYSLTFSNALRIFSLSSNEDAQAGKRGDRILDEFGLHPRQRRLYGIAYPGITWGGQMEIFSTHRGSHSYFNELVREVKEKGNPRGISFHRVTLEDALNEGLLYKLQCKLPEGDERQQMDETDYFNFVKAGAGDEETFLEEYMCVPSDDAGAFLSFELIDGVKYLHGIPWEKDLEELTGEVYIGVDIGRRKDYTVIWVLEKVAGLWLTRLVEKLPRGKVTFSEQKKIITDIFRRSRCRRMRIDETGIGMNIAEDLKKLLGNQVEPVTFTIGNKEEMAYAVRNAMEDKNLRIPDDREITAAFRKIRKEHTSGGHERFIADDNKDGHADEFWALGLALTAGKRPSELKPPRKGRNPRRETTRRNRSIFN